MSTAIVWFRQDLRCQQNPALQLACAHHDKIIPIYIQENDSKLSMGSAQKWWLHQSLFALQQSLREINLDLFILTGSPLALFKHLISRHDISAIYWNRLYEPVFSARDTIIKSALRGLGISVTSCNASLLHEPWEVTNQQGSYFKVFTPYWRQCLKQMKSIQLFDELPRAKGLQAIESVSIDELNLLPKYPNWASDFPKYWQPGEIGALDRLQGFLDDHLSDYKIARDKPALAGTSRLSPHLHFGEISPHQIWVAVQQAMQDPRCNLQSAHTFLAELGWREFSYHLLYHYPRLPEDNFKPQFNSFPWSTDEKSLALWQKGMTGYPIVDAGMRELWRTGYMHNRVRMVVASFLTKHLLIDWRKGAAWFWDTLLDADLANNSASWQWVAGSGADAAPYYRIFNPVLQGEKFDPEGTYIRRWVPELSKVSNAWIHKPWAAPQGQLPVVLGKDYPEPIVDHQLARQLALDCYQKIKLDSDPSASEGII
jgi:deoxyribodipyrimidine photo-lyase